MAATKCLSEELEALAKAIEKSRDLAQGCETTSSCRWKSPKLVDGCCENGGSLVGTDEPPGIHAEN